MPATRTHHSFCRICECMCGIEVDVRDNRIEAIRPDREHVASEGYVCVKGTSFAGTQHSPDRIVEPMKRSGSTWQAISWTQALREIGERLRAIRAEHGGEAIAHWVGAAAGVNVVTPLVRRAFFEAAGSHAMYGNSSLDCANKFRVCEDMYGSPFRLPFPDVDHSGFLMFLGANPAVSGTSLFHLPHAVRRLRQIVKQGGRVVFVNPRRTETSIAGEHLFIRPDTDVFFLAAFLGEILRARAFDAAHVARHMKGLDRLERVVAPWTPERQERVTGVPADTLRELVEAHRRADGAALYMSTGVNQGRHGTLCFWLQEAINAVSGNLDRRGGSLMGSSGLVDFAAEGRKNGQLVRRTHRHDGLPSIVESYPSAMFAADVLEGPTPPRALFIEASNPLIVAPNPGGRLTEAIRALDLVVSIDLFRNETANLADYILPATTFLEREDIPYAIQSMAGNMPVPYVTYTDPVLEAPPGVRPEWWIWLRLADAAGLTLFDRPWLHRLLQWNARAFATPVLGRLALRPKTLISGMLRGAGLRSASRLMREHPHGVLLEPNRPGTFLGTDRVLTGDGRIELAPRELVEAAADLDASYARERASTDSLKLISKRELKSLNSWMHNNPELGAPATNHLHVHPVDAGRLGLEDGGWASVQSAVDTVVAPVRITDELMPGTVALPFGWGHETADGLSLARTRPGVNVNRLAPDGRDATCPLSGMAVLSGIPVSVRPASAPDAQGVNAPAALSGPH
ncbi:MAG: molybdopterin-dependent oxidoreductase [Myxococcota bacterium]